MPTTNPTTFEHAARARKSILLATVLGHAGCDADAAALLTDEGWAAAEAIAEVPQASPATRSAAIAVLRDRQLNPDPFASFAGSPR